MKRLTEFFIVLIAFAILALMISHAAFAQNEDVKVCLVYFTSHPCGDNCMLTDSFMNGLMKEYKNNLIAIKYYVDASPENQKLFETYGSSYGMPQNVPVLLFGKDNYLSGVDDIYKNAESKILGYLSVDGTNCPLESGFVEPAKLNNANLPGQPEVMNGPENSGLNPAEVVSSDSSTPANNTANNSDIPETGQNPLDSLDNVFSLDEPAKESLLSLIIIVVFLVIVGFLIYFFYEKMQGNL